MLSSSPCHCCRCKHEFSRSHHSRRTLAASPRRTTPGLLSSSHYSLQDRAGDHLPFEPIDPFKPSLSYSLRHIFPSQTPPASDPDPVVAALLSPCAPLASSLTSRSQSSRRRTPRTSSDKASSFSGDAQPPTTPRVKPHMEPQYRHYQPSRGVYTSHRSPLHPCSPKVRGSSAGLARSDTSHGSARPEIAIEGPEDASEPPPSPSDSVMSDFVRSYSQDLSTTGSPTLFSGSVRSGLPPIKEVDDITPTAHPTQTMIVHSRESPLWGYPSSLSDKDLGDSQEQDEHSQEGVTLSIRSEQLYTAPRLHSPPKPRRKRFQVTTTRKFPNAAPIVQQSLKSPPPPSNGDRAAEAHDNNLSHTGKSLSPLAYIFVFIIDTIPRQLYLYLMLCIPYMYFSRVANIFEEAELSLPKIKRGIVEAAYKAKEREFMEVDSHVPGGSSIAADVHRTWRFDAPSTPSIAYFNLQRTWETFVDSLMGEWQTLNIISVLLMSAIIAILQISGPSNDCITRYLALSSLICALMSLIYGCVYIIRFGSMRKAFKAAMWAAEAQRSTTCLLWNVWVFLALPATWLAWSMMLFIACIMSLIWRTGTVKDPESIQITLSEARLPRIAITLLLSLGAIYFVFVLRTLRRYGNAMDKKWHRMVSDWISSHQQQKLASASKLSSRFASPQGQIHRPRTPTTRRFWNHTQPPRSTSTHSSWYN